MSALICGFLSYDTVMVLDNKFRQLLLPNSVQTFDIHFTVPDLRRQFGGSAGNIAYNLKHLGVEAFPMATVGIDFDAYAHWLDSHKINRRYLTKIEHCYTAQTFITVDMDDNQMTAFHPGAMSFSHCNRVSPIKGISIGTVSADDAEAMLLHAAQFSELGIPFVFDPGQTLKNFDGDDLLKFLEQASWILVNQQEWQIMQQRTGVSPQQAAKRVRAVIITQGFEGAVIYTQGTYYQIPNASVKAVNDSRGCSNAFCAGLLYGLLKDIDWETTGRIATLMGAIKVEHHGSQTHSFSLDAFKAQFKKDFGYALIV